MGLWSGLLDQRLRCRMARFAARGAGAKLTWVCPSLDLVITQNPGPWERFSPDDEARQQRIREILGRIVETLKA